MLCWACNTDQNPAEPTKASEPETKEIHEGPTPARTQTQPQATYAAATALEGEDQKPHLKLKGYGKEILGVTIAGRDLPPGMKFNLARDGKRKVDYDVASGQPVEWIKWDSFGSANNLVLRFTLRAGRKAASQVADSFFEGAGGFGTKQLTGSSQDTSRPSHLNAWFGATVKVLGHDGLEKTFSFRLGQGSTDDKTDWWLGSDQFSECWARRQNVESDGAKAQRLDDAIVVATSRTVFNLGVPDKIVPGAHRSTAGCPPNDAAYWMEADWETIKDAPLSQLAFPGTHDAFTYFFDNIVGFGYPRTQDLDITGQLNYGIRYFDARFQGQTRGASLDDPANITWCVDHALHKCSGEEGNVAKMIQTEIRDWIEDPNNHGDQEKHRELIIISLSHLSWDGGTEAQFPDEYQQLKRALVEDWVGKDSILGEYAIAPSEVLKKTPAELFDGINTPRVLILNHDSPRKFLGGYVSVPHETVPCIPGGQNTPCVHDRYANDADIGDMREHQLQKYRDNHSTGDWDRMFLLSWTLTPGLHTPFELAKDSNPRLWEFLDNEGALWRHDPPKFVNVLYIDYAGQIPGESATDSARRVNAITQGG